jgi:hypothetical protein
VTLEDEALEYGKTSPATHHHCIWTGKPPQNWLLALPVLDVLVAVDIPEVAVVGNLWVHS